MIIEGKLSKQILNSYILERCNEIERANKILLERMTSILAGPATHTS